MIGYNQYLDMLKRISMDKIIENNKFPAYIDKLLSLYRTNKVESSYKVLAAIDHNDFIDAYNDMKDIAIYEKILDILNKKLSQEGEEFDINTPENHMLGLANRYAHNAQECKMMHQWTLFAFYMRSLAYFIPILLDKANLKEDKVLEKVEAATDISYQDLVKELDEKFAIAKNELDRIKDRFHYRMLINVSYPLDKANKIEDEIWKELDKITKEISKLYSKIG